MVLRSRQGKPEGYRAWGYPVTPVLFIITTLLIAVYFGFTHPKESLSGLATALLGALLYFISDTKSKEVEA
jgi:APA family basic amino acid/polyamine antiporter